MMRYAVASNSTFLVGAVLSLKFIALLEVCFWPSDSLSSFLMLPYVFVLAERFRWELRHIDYSTLLCVQFKHQVL